MKRTFIAFVKPMHTLDDMRKWAADPAYQSLAFDHRPTSEQLEGIDAEVLSKRPDMSVILRATDEKPWDFGLLDALPSHKRLYLHYSGHLLPAQLPELARLSTLRYLNLSTWGIKDCSVLRDVPPSLEALSLGDTLGKKKGLRTLVGFPGLRQLAVLGPVDDPTAFGEMTLLESLNIQSISHSDLSFLRPLTWLREMRLALGGFQSLDGLEALHNLRYLEMWRVRGITDIGHVRSLHALRHLYLDSMSEITALPDLSSLANLHTVKLSTMRRLRDLAGVAQAPNLLRFMFVEANSNFEPDQFEVFLEHPTVKAIFVGWKSGGRRLKALAAAASAAGKITDPGEWWALPVPE